MNVRWAQVHDAAGIARLHVASWQATYRNELPAALLEAQDLAERTVQWEAVIASPANVLIAEDGEELVGFVACGPTRDAVAEPASDFEIYDLHVTPDRHEEGVGSALFDAALELASASSASMLSLWVVETNAEGRRFYESKGMQPDGAGRTRALGRDAELRELRYRTRLEHGEVPGSPDLKPLPLGPQSLGGRIALFVIGIGVAACGLYFTLTRERVATVQSQRQLEEAPVAQARRTAEREIQLLLRPREEDNIGGDQPVRRWRLGMAYGRLAMIEERAGDIAKRDRYLHLAKRALREAGVRDSTDDYIRENLRTRQASP